VAKRIYRVDQFHGGINSNSAHRDIDKDELVDAVDVDIDTVGQLNIIESSANHTNDFVALSHTVNPGYGLFHFKSDYSRTGAKKATDYLAIADSTPFSVDIVTREHDNTVGWDQNEIVLSESDASDAKQFSPTFYVADGALRVSANHPTSTKAHGSKWYGVINRKLFEGTKSVPSISTNWYQETQSLDRPDPSSVYNLSSAGMVLGTDQSFSYGATSIVSDTSGVYSNTTGALIRAGWGLDDTTTSYMEKMVVSVAVRSKASGVSGADDDEGYFDFTVQAGEMSNSTTFIADKNQIVRETGDVGHLEGGSIDVEIPINLQAHDGGGGSSTYESKIWGVKILYTAATTTSDIASIEILKSGVKCTQRQTTGATGPWDLPSYTQNNANSVFVGARFQTDTLAHDGSEGAYGWDKNWNTGVSFLYDDFGPLQQESLITQMGNSANPSNKITGPQNFGTGEDKAPTIYLGLKYNASTWNKRITGARIYMKSEDDREWHPQATCNFVDGTIQSMATGKKQKCKYVDDTSGAASGITGWIFHLDRKNLLTPHLIDTFRSMTGFDHEQDFINPNYGTSVVVGRTVYIGNLKVKKSSTKENSMPDTMLKCVPNRFDTFPATRKVDVAIRDGESIVTLMEFADRILQFKESTLYIINVSGDSEYLEDVHHFKGIKHPGSVCKTAFGIFWVNEFGAYLYDGRNITDLTEPKGMRKIKQTTWASFITDSSIVAYIPKRKQVMVISDADSAGDHELYMYNFTTQGWVRGVDRIGSGDITNIVVDWNGDPCWSTGSDLKAWDLTTSASDDFKVTTRDIDFGEPGVTKKVTKVLVTYRTAPSGATSISNVLAKYSINGKTSEYEGTFKSESANYDPTNGFAASSGWTVAELLPSTTISANKVFSMQLKFETKTASSVPAGFAINDISLIYRPKPVTNAIVVTLTPDTP